MFDKILVKNIFSKNMFLGHILGILSGFFFIKYFQY